MSKSKWIAPPSGEAGYHHRRIGMFKLFAWDDGSWSVIVRGAPLSAPIRRNRNGEEAASLDRAKACAEGVMLNLIADAASDFGIVLPPPAEGALTDV